MSCQCLCTIFLVHVTEAVDFYTMMPARPVRTLQHDFELMHIDRVWDELHTLFHFDKKGWKKRFAEYLLRQKRGVSEVEAFFRFGNDQINPVLNEILSRRNGYDTFNSLCRYVLNKS
ncbi:MAG: hypothetical protein JNM57_13095 [Cyclobacteriaceae bacterium]|nr:hypothetical protein [Cyclobacteriaceae bacterium]